MAHVHADRVADTTTTTGTGAVTLSGSPPTGYRTFSAVMATNDTCYYAIASGSSTEWEVGLGTYSSANTLTRTTVLASSNGNAAVNFSAGQKDVFITDPAAKDNGTLYGATTNLAIAKFNGTDGNIQNSGVLIDASNNITGAGTIDVGNADTTIARVSAGLISVEGGNVPLENRANSFTANQTITSSSANALAVGRQGTTSPALNVDASTASSATGLNIKAAAAAGGVAVSAISSGTNENLTIDAKGSGTITLAGTSTGNTIITNGNVGIGTASPSVKLHVYTGSATTTYAYVGNTAGTGLYGCDGSGTAYAYSSGSGAMLVGTSGAANLLFYTNAAERMRINSSGNVGIGVTPSNLLHVYRNNTATGAQVQVEQDGTGNANIGFLLTGVYAWLVGADATDNYFKIAASGTGLSTNTRLTIDTSGNVGIGRTPTYLLDVNSTARFNNTISVGNATPSSSGAGISFPATQSASTDANTLDDYEEGTFTPTATSSGGSITSYTSSGQYTKIGNVVTIQGYVKLTNVGTATGYLNATIPFTSVNFVGTAEGQFCGAVREAASTGNIFFLHVLPNSATVYMQNSTNGGITWTNNYVYVFTLTYRVA